MRKLLALFILVLCTSVQAQVKEGFIKFKMELTGAPAGDDMGSLLGNASMTIYFKNDKSLTEMVSPIYNMKTLTDSKGVLMVMETIGQKSFTRKTNEELEKEKPKGNDPQVVITKEKKKILGYDCTKALITTKDNKDKSSTTVMWFTDKIRCAAIAGVTNTEVLNKINGTPLQIELDRGAVKSRITAAEISVKPVADAVFVFPTTGYTERKGMPAVKH
jgi:GLPGLI family protein